MALIGLGPCLLAGGAMAQTAPAATAPAATAKPIGKKSHSVSGSPLDTFRSTHIHATVAPAKDFVKESRPDEKTLDYVPLTGVDPERPKARDAANVLALQAELDRDRAVNEGRGRAFAGSTGKARKTER